MRVLTWNVQQWHAPDGASNVEGVAALLATANADIVGLNEVVHPQPLPGERHSALDWLAAQLGMYCVFGPAQRWPAHESMPERSLGNALLARRPLLASAGHHLSATPAAEDRGLLEARVLLEADGEGAESAFTVYVTQFDAASEETRVAQFRHARQWLIRDRNRPHLLMGCFNAISAWDFAERPENLAALAADTTSAHGAALLEGGAGPRLLAAVEKAGYTDAGRALGSPGDSTLAAAAPALRLDYLCASAPLAPRLAAYGILEGGDALSQHRPVWVEFDLASPPPGA